MQENYPTLAAVRQLKPEFQHLDTIPVTSEEFTMGRALGGSVVIPFLPLSRKHCILRKHDNEHWTIEDMSHFGILVNGSKVKKNCAVKLSNQDILQLDPTGEFLYKFILDPDDPRPPAKKKIKIEQRDILEDVKQKFAESQNHEIEHLEQKILNAKQLQTTSMILKQQLEMEMEAKMKQLEEGFSAQIESLRGEKTEVERQKASLEEERDTKLAGLKHEMEERVNDLLSQIKKHNESETELLNENTTLKERLVNEREQFLEELNRENASKHDLLKQLEAKMRDQEEQRLKEKQELEESLRKETEQLKLAKEQALKALEEQMQREKEQREIEVENMRKTLEQQAHATADEKARAELEFQQKVEELRKAAEEDKMKMEVMCLAREEAERKLKEAKETTEKSLEELTKKVQEKEVELAMWAETRIREQSQQSSEMVQVLQEQLNKVKSDLESVETERQVLLESIVGIGEQSTTKQTTLTEVGELMENELQCSICNELFIAAITLNCSHTFCKYCITQWKKKKKDCPICRTKITSECKSLVLDSFIEKMVQNLTEEMKNKRAQILIDREEIEAQANQPNAGNSSNRGGSSDESDSFLDHSSDIDQSEYWSGQGEDEEHYFEYPGYSSYNPFDTSGGSDDSEFYSDDEYERLTAASATTPAAPADHDLGTAPADGPSTDVNAEGSLSPSTTGAVGGSAASTRTTRGSRRGTSSRSRQTIEGVPGSYYGGYGRCFSCGARGHWAPGCPFR